jgi:predicted dinucleotide-binding enzyme
VLRAHVRPERQVASVPPLGDHGADRRRVRSSPERNPCKDVGAARQDWSGKIVIDVTNAFTLPPEVQQAEYQGRLTSEVNAERVPGAKLVKAFNQLPFKVLASPLPDDVGRRVVFVSSDHKDASATSRLSRKALALQPSKSARLQKAAA